MFLLGVLVIVSGLNVLVVNRLIVVIPVLVVIDILRLQHSS
jgi:hypothetical protein